MFKWETRRKQTSRQCITVQVSFLLLDYCDLCISSVAIDLCCIELCILSRTEKNPYRFKCESDCIDFEIVKLSLLSNNIDGDQLDFTDANVEFFYFRVKQLFSHKTYTRTLTLLHYIGQSWVTFW